MDKKFKIFINNLDEMTSDEKYKKKFNLLLNNFFYDFLKDKYVIKYKLGSQFEELRHIIKLFSI